jgi:hypothetical protein
LQEEAGGYRITDFNGRSHAYPPSDGGQRVSRSSSGNGA